VTYPVGVLSLAGTGIFHLVTVPRLPMRTKRTTGVLPAAKCTKYRKLTTRLNLVSTSIISGGYVISLCIFTELFLSIETIYLYLLHAS